MLLSHGSGGPYRCHLPCPSYLSLMLWFHFVSYSFPPGLTFNSHLDRCLFLMVHLAFGHCFVLDVVSGSILIPFSEAVLPTGLEIPVQQLLWEGSEKNAHQGQVSFSLHGPRFIYRKKLLETTLESSIKTQGIVIKLCSGL